LAALKLSNGKPQGRGPGGPGGWHRQLEQAHDTKATFKRLLGFLRLSDLIFFFFHDQFLLLFFPTVHITVVFCDLFFLLKKF
jgi:hypothetical protein